MLQGRGSGKGGLQSRVAPPWRSAAVGAIAAVGVVASLLVAASAGGAVAAGGDSIATATALPIGTRVVNTNRRPEYWRVELGLADEFVVDIGSRNAKFSVEMCLLDPEVNDYSADETPCRAATSTNTKRQMRFVASSPGSWIAVVWGCRGCVLFRPQGASFAPYEFTARVRRYTSVNLLAPAKVKAGSSLVLQGAVEGAGAGPLQIVRRAAGRWVPLGTTQLQADGSFRFTTALYRPGIVRVGVMYAGDDRHRPSSETRTVTVR